MAWTPQATASLPATPHPHLGPAVFIGFYLLLIGVMRLWSALLARRVTYKNLDRSLRGFGRVLLFVRFLVPAWFAIGTFVLGWGALVDKFAGYWKPMELPGVLIGTLPAFAAWAGLWWSQYPADRSLREHNLLDELEADLPVHAPPSFREYFTSNLRLQLLFTAIPVLAIVLTRDVLSVTFRAVKSLSTMPPDRVEFLTMLLAAATVFVLAPEILRRVLQTQPLPDSPLRRRLEALCERVGMRYRDILLWRTQNHMGNAAVMGILPPVRYILLSDLLLERMDDEQIEAVFAHEVGHVMHRHMAWYVVVIMVFMLGFLVVNQFVLGHLPGVAAALPEGVSTMLSIVAFGGVFFLYFGFISRRFERQADVYAARLIEASAKGRVASPTPPSVPARIETPQALAALVGTPVPAEPQPIPRVHASPPSTYVGPYGAGVFASALHRVAVMNNIPLAPRRRPRRGFFRRMGHSIDGLVESLHNWLHGSIHDRREYLRGLSADPALTGRFDRFMVRLYCALLFALFACAAFVFASSGPFN